MSQPKISTNLKSVQLLPATSAIQLACGDMGLTVNDGMPALTALTVASDLAEAVNQISERIHDAINGGDTPSCAEMFAIGFLAETCSALIRSVNPAQAAVGGAE